MIPKTRDVNVDPIKYAKQIQDVFGLNLLVNGLQQRKKATARVKKVVICF